MAPADHIKTESDCAYIFPSAGTGYILFFRLLFRSGIRTADCPFFVYFISGIRKRNPEHFIGFELFFQGEYRAMEPLAHGQKGLYQWHCKQPAGIVKILFKIIPWRITGTQGISFLFKKSWDIWKNEPACSPSLWILVIFLRWRVTLSRASSRCLSTFRESDSLKRLLSRKPLPAYAYKCPSPGTSPSNSCPSCLIVAALSPYPVKNGKGRVIKVVFPEFFTPLTATTTGLSHMFIPTASLSFLPDTAADL